MKKALSPVIATVLLILLSVVLITIIAAAIIPFIRDKLEEAEQCAEVVGVADALVIDSEKGYFCYYTETGRGEKKTVKITLHRGDIDIEGIKISIVSKGESEVYDIKEMQVEDKVGEIEMLNSGIDLTFPGKRGEETYIIDTDLTEEDISVVIAPILKNEKICRETDRAELEKC